MDLVPAFGERSGSFLTPTEARDALIRHWGAEPSASTTSFEVSGVMFGTVGGIALEAARQLTADLAKENLPSFALIDGETWRIKGYWERLHDALYPKEVAEQGENDPLLYEVFLWAEDKVQSVDGVEARLVDSPIVIRKEDVLNWIKNAPTKPAVDSADDPSKQVFRTNKRPYWFPYLKDLYLQQDKREAKFKLEHPQQTPPLFPKSPWFEEKLKAKFKDQPEIGIATSTVRRWVAKLNEEYGRKECDR